jgi:chorismate synthase
MGSSFGKMFRITTFGESHGPAVGVIIEGVPAGMPLSEEDIQKELDRRRPGQSIVTSPRREPDRVKILSGVFEGKTLGTPICLMIENVEAQSEVYDEFKHLPRPGHADLAYWLKYGHVDYRGGGRAAGRETVGRVAAGAVAKKLLFLTHRIEIAGHTVEAAGVSVGRSVDWEEIKRNTEMNPMRCADLQVAKEMERKVLEAWERGDSTGGIVEVIAINVPPGLGEPVFDKLDADIAKAMMSIGGVKGVEIGAGFSLARMYGSQANDPIVLREGKLTLETNRAGGILGGISVGSPIVVRLAIKPTPSISLPQRTVNLLTREETEIKLKGRFDPNLCPRIVPVAEAMLALVLADHMLRAGKISPNRFA